MASELPDDKVEIIISPNHASPINAAYEYVGKDGPLNIGDTVILGASTKDDDWKRWTGAEKYIKDGVKLKSPERTAVKPTMRSKTDDEGKPLPYGATAFRDALGNPEDRAEIADFVGKENVDNVLSILGLEGKVDEMSAGATGSVVGGIGVPLASGSAKRRRPKKKPANENIAIANEVIRLIMERGILR